MQIYTISTPGERAPRHGRYGTYALGSVRQLDCLGGRGFEVGEGVEGEAALCDLWKRVCC